VKKMTKNGIFKTAKGTRDLALFLLLAITGVLAIHTFGIAEIDIAQLSGVVAVGIGLILVNEGIRESSDKKKSLLGAGVLFAELEQLSNTKQFFLRFLHGITYF